MDWGQTAVDLVIPQCIDKGKCKNHYLCKYVCDKNGSYAQANDLPSKLIPNPFLEKAGNSGDLHWCLCGSRQKHQKYLCHMLVSVWIFQPTQVFQMYQGQGWHIDKFSEGPWSQYSTYYHRLYYLMVLLDKLYTLMDRYIK